jgi:hypothetical protein
MRPGGGSSQRPAAGAPSSSSAAGGSGEDGGLPTNPPTAPSVLWVDRRIPAWKAQPDAPVSPTPLWAELHIAKWGGYAQVFATEDWRVIAQPRGRQHLVMQDQLFVVFRDGTHTSAEAFIATGIPTGVEGTRHLFWPDNRRLRVPDTFHKMVRYAQTGRGI